MFVKDRTGRTRAVADGYVLADGESISLGMMAFDAAPIEDCVASVTVTPGRNGPPVVVKDDDVPTRSAEFAKGAAFASQAIYERRVSDASRQPEPEDDR